MNREGGKKAAAVLFAPRVVVLMVGSTKHKSLRSLLISGEAMMIVKHPGSI